MKLNLENFEKVKAAIRAEPENLSMSHWHCGTAHCIAGWAQLLGTGTCNSQTVEHDACNFLGIDSYRFAFVHLFALSMWPLELYDEYFSLRIVTVRDRAEVACKAIDWFIDTYEDKE